MDDSTRKPNVVLRYFDAAGRAEPIRLALADAGVAFDDVRVASEHWLTKRVDAAFSGPFRALPTLTWDDAFICETLPLATFVANKLGHHGGLDDIAIARAEAICSSAYLDILVRCGESIYSDMMYPGADVARSFAFVGARVLEKLECIEACSDATWIGGDRPVMADFFATEAYVCGGLVFGPKRQAALAKRLPRLHERRD